MCNWVEMWMMAQRVLMGYGWGGVIHEVTTPIRTEMFHTSKMPSTVQVYNLSPVCVLIHLNIFEHVHERHKQHVSCSTLHMHVCVYV